MISKDSVQKADSDDKTWNPSLKTAVMDSSFQAGRNNIYLHVPFCARLCSYCAFERTLNLSLKDAWFRQILKESRSLIADKIRKNPGWKIDTLYFGGGTPSLLNTDEIENLASVFFPYFSQDYEWTIEVNPETVDENWLKSIKKAGVNRLSIGIQSFDDQILRDIGRKHTSEKAIEIIHQARKAGFDNISSDLIFGFPMQSFDQLKKDLEVFMSLHLEHISIYSLQIEENSVFGKKGVKPVDPDLEADEFEWIVKTLKEAGYEHYEISSFASGQNYSKHNLSVWLSEDYDGIGFGACGKDEISYYHHVQSLHEYLESGPKLMRDDSDFWFTSMMLGFRTQFGLNIGSWNRKYSHLFSSDWLTLAGTVIEKYPDCFEWLILRDQKRICLNEKGREILNTVLGDLLEVFESALQNPVF